MAKHPTGLVLVLRLLGVVDLLALLAVVLPLEWMAKAHGWLGLGELPHQPIVGYLTRSASALYALHGAMIVFISFDPARYARLITFLAAAALVHGAIMFAIDLVVRMPVYWTLLEGPAFAATGAVVLWMQRKDR